MGIQDYVKGNYQSKRSSTPQMRYDLSVPQQLAMAGIVMTGAVILTGAVVMYSGGLRGMTHQLPGHTYKAQTLPVKPVIGIKG